MQIREDDSEAMICQEVSEALAATCMHVKDIVYKHEHSFGILRTNFVLLDFVAAQFHCRHDSFAIGVA